MVSLLIPLAIAHEQNREEINPNWLECRWEGQRSHRLDIIERAVREAWPSDTDERHVSSHDGISSAISNVQQTAVFRLAKQFGKVLFNPEAYTR